MLPHSTGATDMAGRVRKATGSMVSVLSSTAARTSAESCKDQGAGRKGCW